MVHGGYKVGRDLTGYDNLLVGIAMGLGAPRVADTEDLVQEGRIGTLEALRTYEPGKGRSLRSWVYIVARRCMVQFIRDLKGDTRPNGRVSKRKKEETPISQFGDRERQCFEEVTTEDFWNSEEAIIEQEEVKSLLARSGVSKDQKEALFIYAEGHTYEEAGRILEITTPAAHSRVRKALRKIQATLDRDERERHSEGSQSVGGREVRAVRAEAVLPREVILAPSGAAKPGRGVSPRPEAAAGHTKK